VPRGLGQFEFAAEKVAAAADHLYLVVCVAVPLWQPVRAVAAFAGGAVTFNLVAVYAFPSPGAGNSGATFFLATAVLGLLLIRHRSPQIILTGVAVAAIGAGLVVAGDAHGLALLGGCAAGAAIAATVCRTTPSPRWQSGQEAHRRSRV
jgi:hypothetical protein